jgi:hypothetical protein
LLLLLLLLLLRSLLLLLQLLLMLSLCVQAGRRHRGGVRGLLQGIRLVGRLAGVLAAEDSSAGSGKSARVQCGHVGLCVLWT